MLLAAGEVKSVPRAAYAIFKCSRGKPSILGISLIPLSSGRWTSQALLGGQDLPPGMRVRIYDSIKGEYVCDERRADGSWSTNATFGLGTGFTVLVPESAPKASYDICLAGEMLLRDSVTNRLALSRGLSSDWCPIPRACPGCRDLTSRLRIAINAGMEQDAQVALARRALVLLCERCPRLVGLCYWAGTAAIATEELHHRQSFDLDFHTRRALVNVSPILAELRVAFGDGFEVVQAPDEFGSGFQGVLTLPEGERITIEVLSNYEDVPEADLVDADTVSSLKRVSLVRYLGDKIQCVAERVEARDLVDIAAVLRHAPGLRETAKALLAQQDALLLVERLLAWSDEEIARDLEAYDGVAPSDAAEARDLLLGWLKHSEDTP